MASESSGNPKKASEVDLMTLQEARQLRVGLYRVWWKSDPDRPSLAAVGQCSDGNNWLAPANWLEPDTRDRHVWRRVDRVELIQVPW